MIPADGLSAMRSAATSATHRRADGNAQRSDDSSTHGTSGLQGLRIGLVGPLPPPAGGMANQTFQLSELLRSAGAGVTLVQTNAAYRPAWAGRVPMLRAVFRMLPFLLALWRAAGRSDLFHVMANSGWSWHLFATPAILIARLRGVPVIVNYRGGEAATFLARQANVVRWSMRRTAALAVPSSFLLQVFAQHGMNAVVVPNIIDLARFRPRSSSREATAHIVVARNLEPIYDNETALKAFAMVLRQRPETRLTIAGSGPEHARLVGIAEQLGVSARVTFTGRIDRDAMAALMSRADVALNPSLVDNMPNSVLEAMACGVPVVSTNVGGVPFIVEDDVTALLVEPRDERAMAAALLRVLDDEMVWARLSAAGTAEVGRYAWPRVAPVLASLYRSAL